MAKHMCQIVLEFKRGDYADLKQKYGDDWLYVSAHQDLGLGANAPPGVPDQVWIAIYCTLFCVRAGLVAAWTTLAAVMHWLLGQLNPAPGNSPDQPKLWPTPQLILDVLLHAPHDLWSSKGEYCRSLIQQLEAVIWATGELTSVFKGLDLERDVIAKGKSIVIDMSNIKPPWLRMFFIDLLLAQLLYGRLHRQHRTSEPEVIVYIDEADAYVSRESEKSFPDGMSLVSEAARYIRESGVVLVFGLSHLGQASRYIVNSATYHAIFNLCDAPSIAEAAKTLMLPPRGGLTFPGLKPGECIFRQAQSSWPHGILC